MTLYQRIDLTSSHTDYILVLIDCISDDAGLWWAALAREFVHIQTPPSRYSKIALFNLTVNEPSRRLC